MKPSPRISRLDDVVPQPWRNGGGTTRELLAWPPEAADADAWRLRVSIAEVASDGPFSPFPGVSRWFAVLEGAGVRLEWKGRTQTVRPDDDPVAFDGADPPTCHLVVGRTLDLNLMLRGEGRAAMRRAGAGSTVDGALTWRGLYAHDTAQLAIGSDAPLAVEPGTLVWSDEATPSSWTLVSSARAWWMMLVS